MGEAITLTVVTGLAGLISSLVLKALDVIAKKSEKKGDSERSFREEISEDRERLKIENTNLYESIEKERSKKEEWRAKYWALFRQYDYLRLNFARTTSEYAPTQVGLAPHEKEDLD